MFKPQKRTIAKYAVRIATVLATTVATEAALNAVINDTDEDNANIHTGSLMIGAVSSFHINGYTDKVIDRIADNRAARQEQTEINEVAAV